MITFATLHYLHADMQYAPELAKITGRLLQEFYTPVISMPLSEMMSEGPAWIADYLYARTTSVAWHNRLRRAVRAGDCLTIGESIWVFIPAQDAPIFGDATILTLPDLPFKLLSISTIQDPLHSDEV